MFTINYDEVKETSGGNSKFINKSGIYPVIINFASVETSKNGAVQVNFNVTYEGETQVLYGPYVQSKDGKELEIGTNLIKNLAVIAGVPNGETLTVSTQEHAVGKDNTVKEFEVIEEFTDLPVYVYVQEEYSKYNGEIRQRLNIRDFFRAEDGASASEIIKGADFGKRMELVKEKYADNVRYDGVTEEEVEEWKKNGFGKKGNTPKPKAKSSAKTKLFGK